MMVARRSFWIKSINYKLRIWKVRHMKITLKFIITAAAPFCRKKNNRHKVPGMLTEIRMAAVVLETIKMPTSTRREHQCTKEWESWLIKIQVSRKRRSKTWVTWSLEKCPSRLWAVKDLQEWLAGALIACARRTRILITITWLTATACSSEKYHSRAVLTILTRARPIHRTKVIWWWTNYPFLTRCRSFKKMTLVWVVPAAMR